MNETPTAGRSSLALLCAILVGLFQLTTIREGHEWGDDFSMYILHARNIARGAPYAETGYIYNPQNPSVGPRQYPPGFPLLLAPVIKVFGLDLRAMKVLVIGFFAASLLVCVRLFRGSLPPAYLTALVLVMGLNPFFWEAKDHVLSDVPFLFFTLLSLRLFMRADEESVSNRRRVALALAAGAAGYAAYATRVLGIVLAPCFIAHDLMRHRTIRVEALLASVMLLALAGAQHVLWVHDTSYLDQLTGTAAGAGRNLVPYLQALSDLWENGHSDALRKGAFLASVGLAGAGYLGSLRADPTAFHVFPLLYLLPVIVWPAFQGTRFLIPIVPFYLYYGLLGIRAIDEAAERLSGKKSLVIATCLVAVLTAYAARYSTLRFGSIPEGVAKRESVELFEFVKAATDSQEVFVFSRPRALALFGDRRAAAPHRADDPCGLWQFMRAIRASYVVTGPEPDRWNADAPYLRRFVTRFRNDFRRVMGNRDLAVYRIEQNPASGRTASCASTDSSFGRTAR